MNFVHAFLAPTCCPLLARLGESGTTIGERLLYPLTAGWALIAAALGARSPRLFWPWLALLAVPFGLQVRAESTDVLHAQGLRLRDSSI